MPVPLLLPQVCFAMLATVMAYWHHICVGLSIAPLHWKLAEYLLILWRLILGKQDFQVRSRLGPLGPISEVYGAYINRDLPSTSERQLKISPFFSEFLFLDFWKFLLEFYETFISIYLHNFHTSTSWLQLLLYTHHPSSNYYFICVCVHM